MKDCEMGGACSTYMRYNKHIYSFSQKVRRKGSLGKPRRRWEDEMQLCLKRTEYGVEWI